MTKSRIDELLAKAVITIPEAGSLVGLSRDGAYDAAKRGEIPTLRFGRCLKVPTAALRKMLQIEAPEAA